MTQHAPTYDVTVTVREMHTYTSLLSLVPCTAQQPGLIHSALTLDPYRAPAVHPYSEKCREQLL